MAAVPRSIIGFAPDAQGHWTAALSCGHGQHVRHDPPWQLRPWVLTEQGRRDHLGAALLCVSCGMPTIPPGVERDKSTPAFDEATIPAALLRRHTLKPGVWGRIVVGEGRLLYVIEGDPEESFVLQPEVPGIVAPEAPHHIQPCGRVRFHIEFLASKPSRP